MKFKKLRYIGLLTSICASTYLYAEEENKSAEDAVLQSNNPFSDVLFAKYEHVSSLDDGAEGSSGILQVGKGVGNWLVRATLPVIQGTNDTDIGDLAVLIPRAWTLDNGMLVGAGLNFSLPTATSDNIGYDSLGLGFGAGYMVMEKGNPFSHSGLLTYLYNVDADTVEDERNQFQYQPFMFWQLGDGTYLRSSAQMTFDLHNDEYHVPVGLGIGQVIKTSGVTYNFYAEVQQAVYLKGDDFDNTKFMMGLKLDFK